MSRLHGQLHALRAKVGGWSSVRYVPEHCFGGSSAAVLKDDYVRIVRVRWLCYVYAAVVRSTPREVMVEIGIAALEKPCFLNWSPPFFSQHSWLFYFDLPMRICDHAVADYSELEIVDVSAQWEWVYYHVSSIEFGNNVLTVWEASNVYRCESNVVVGIGD